MLITAEVARRANGSVSYEAMEPRGLRVVASGEAFKPTHDLLSQLAFRIVATIRVWTSSSSADACSFWRLVFVSK